MILTTTNEVSGRSIKEYRGIVFGEVVKEIDFLKEFGGAGRNMPGVKEPMYQVELEDARTTALSKLVQQADRMGANAVVGVSHQYQVLGSSGNTLLVTVSGTAVTLNDK